MSYQTNITESNENNDGFQEQLPRRSTRPRTDTTLWRSDRFPPNFVINFNFLTLCIFIVGSSKLGE